MEQEKKFTFWERITSDTPSFFKKVQLFGLGLVTLGTSLTQVHGIKEEITTIIISVGGALAAVAQFTVKQCEVVTPASDNLVKPDESEAPADEVKK